MQIGKDAFSNNLGLSNVLWGNNISDKTSSISTVSNTHTLTHQKEVLSALLWNQIDSEQSLSLIPPSNCLSKTKENLSDILWGTTCSETLQPLNPHNAINTSIATPDIEHVSAAQLDMLISKDLPSYPHKKSQKLYQPAHASLNPKKSSLSNTKAKPSADELAQSIIETKELLVHKSCLYIYDSCNAYYYPLTMPYADLWIRQTLPRQYRKFLNLSFNKEILQWLKSSTKIQSLNVIPYNYINFNNGILDTDDLDAPVLQSHNPNMFTTHYIDANYEYDYDTLPHHNFQEYIEFVTQNDPNLIDLLQELLGYCLSNIRSIKKAFILLGPPNTGKSTFLKLLEGLIGQDFYSNVSLSELNDKFKLHLIHNKRLNTCGEIGEKTISRLDVLKKLTGGDALLAEKKGEDAFSFYNTACLVFSGNMLPHLGSDDAGKAFNSRFIIIPFTASLDSHNINPNLLESLLEEKDYIVSWAIDGLARLQHNNFIFTPLDTQSTYGFETLNYSCIIENFIKENCIIGNQYKVKKSDLLTSFTDYCSTHNINPVCTQSLISYLDSEFGLVNKKIRIGETTHYGFKGIGLNIP